MIKLPIENQWTQTNTSDKFGSLAYTKNINLDSEGYISLSHRSANIFDDTSETTNIADTNFSIPTAFGRTGVGYFYLSTTDEPFNITLSSSAKTITEDVSANSPNLNFMSHGCWWQNRFYESTDTAVSYNTGGTWTANAITGLTSGKRHTLAVFRNRRTLCVANGNEVKQYDTSHSETTKLTIPSDYEVVGMAYNNYRMGIVARLGSDSSGQNAESYFFAWDGSTTEAQTGIAIGAYNVVGLAPYGGTFVILTSAGELKIYNGGGFETLASFPFYSDDKTLGDLLNYITYGDSMVVDGDVVYIYVNFNLSSTGQKRTKHMPNNPAGVWCYDPKVGLYHRYSASNSRLYLHTITSGNVNTSTDIITTTATIPDTGNPVVLTNGGLGGIDSYKIYYVIKHSSTTFSVAESKTHAQSGVKIDITSADSSSALWMLDVLDYGVSFCNETSGAIALYGTSAGIFTDIIFGGRLLATDSGNNYVLNSIISLFENRGYFVTPKIYSPGIKDIYQKVVIKHRPLDVEDAIIIKYRNKEYLNVPISTPNGLNSNTQFTWTSNDEGTTTADISEVKTLFDSGVEIECEFTSGIGAGQLVKVTSIDYGDGVYALGFAEQIVGATAGLRSDILLNNWTVCGTVNSANATVDGIYECRIDKPSKWVELKCELRGFKTTIEDLQIINETFKPSV